MRLLFWAEVNLRSLYINSIYINLIKFNQFPWSKQKKWKFTRVLQRLHRAESPPSKNHKGLVKLHVCCLQLAWFSAKTFSISSEISGSKLSLKFLRVTPQMTFKWLCTVFWTPNDNKKAIIWAKNVKFCTFEARIFEYDRKFCCVCQRFLLNS